MPSIIIQGIHTESSQVLAGLREFTFLHTLTNVPVDERTLGVHEIELVAESVPCLGDGSGVGQQAAVKTLVIEDAINSECHLPGTVDLSQVTVGNQLRRLEADTNLETSGAPVDKLDGLLGLESGNSSMNLLGDNITTVQQAGSHVLAVAGVALDHLVVGLEAVVGNFLDGVGLVGSLGRGNNGSVGDEGEVNPRIRDQVGLELVQVDIKGTIETKRRGDRGDD